MHLTARFRAIIQNIHLIMYRLTPLFVKLVHFSAGFLAKIRQSVTFLYRICTFLSGLMVKALHAALFCPVNVTFLSWFNPNKADNHADST